MPKLLLSVLALMAFLLVACQPEEVIIVPTVVENPSPLPEPTSAIPTSLPFEQVTPLPTLASDPSLALPTATYNLPVTSTLPPITLVFPPTATAQPCVPRADWTASYTIQPGDTLFGIASLYSISTADLQSANCLTDANQIFSGTDLRVPYELTPQTPAAN